MRQAIERFLTANPDADSLAMLLLGQHLGPSTRLHQLGEDAPRSLADWMRSTWPTGAPVAAVRAAADHWLGQGWTTVDLAQEIR